MKKVYKNALFLIRIFIFCIFFLKVCPILYSAKKLQNKEDDKPQGVELKNVDIAGKNNPKFSKKEKKWFLSFELPVIIDIPFEPSGVNLDIDLGRKFSLYDSNNAIFRDNYLSIGIKTRLNPAHAGIGPVITFSPALFFTLEIMYLYAYEWLGVSFDKFGRSRHSSEISDKMWNTPVRHSFHLFSISPTLALKIWKIVFLNMADFIFISSAEEDIFYNQYHGVLQDDELVINNTTVIGFLITNNVITGISSTIKYTKGNDNVRSEIALALLIDNINFISNHDTFIFMIGACIKDDYLIKEYSGAYFMLYYKVNFSW